MFPSWNRNVGQIIDIAAFAPAYLEGIVTSGGAPLTPKGLAGPSRANPTSPGAFQKISL